MADRAAGQRIDPVAPREASGIVSLATSPGIGASVWEFFTAYPLVFLISLVLVLATVLYVVRLLVHHSKWFRLGLTGLEVSRDCDAERPPSLPARLGKALRGRKRGTNGGEPTSPES